MEILRVMYMYALEKSIQVALGARHHCTQVSELQLYRFLLTSEDLDSRISNLFEQYQVVASD